MQKNHQIQKLRSGVAGIAANTRGRKTDFKNRKHIAKNAWHKD